MMDAKTIDNQIDDKVRDRRMNGQTVKEPTTIQKVLFPNLFLTNTNGKIPN